ncbi:competence pheromone ComX [Lysinibacillus sp. NPDC097287]|uniref:competence pheromone ComX n=1 Tax=Lysinibacillus sp. NPDC097287 TaxID=3364144 RepID=UPI00381A5E8E
MIKAIQYLEQNPNLVVLLKEQKASLVGFSAIEQQAVLEAFDQELCLEYPIWK